MATKTRICKRKIDDVALGLTALNIGYLLNCGSKVSVLIWGFRQGAEKQDDASVKVCLFYNNKSSCRRA